MKTCHTICGICEQGCGLTVTTDSNRVLKVEPDKNNPYSWRDYCIKGAKSHLSLRHPDRITTPMKRVGDRYVAASYEEAITNIAARFNRLIDQHGPNAIGSYTGNPNGFNFGSALFHTMLLDAIGTESRFWVGSVDQNALHVVSDAMYGNAWVSLQADIDHCDYYLLIGTNPQISTMCWIGYSPDGWKRVLARKAAGAELVVVDPRRTECAAKATRHIAPLPESDWALVLAMIKLILENGWHTPQSNDILKGLDTIQAIAATANLDALSACCDVPLNDIKTLARDFARAPSAMAIARTGVSQGRNGVLALWLVKVLNYITGRVESEGGLYYVSGILDLLDVGDTLFPHSEAVSRVRGNKNVAGAHSLAELPGEITTPGPGQIRAMIINSGNPVVSGPDGNALDAALAQLDCLVVIDQFQRESHRHADWLIPGDHFLERTEINPLIQALSPSPRAQLSRAAVSPPQGMRYEWEFLRDLTLAMGKPLIPGKAWLNPLIKASKHLAKWTGWNQLTINPMLMARLLIHGNSQIRWRDIVDATHGIGDPTERPEFGLLFSKLREQNSHIDLAPSAFVKVLRHRLAEPATHNPLRPFQLISRRRMKMMNSWSIETSMEGMNSREMTGNNVEINRKEGEALKLIDGQKVKLSSASGSIEAEIRLSDEVRSGVAVMEHGWGYRTFNASRGSSRHHGGVNRNLLVSNDDVDPLSNVPRLNGTPVSIEPILPSA